MSLVLFVVIGVGLLLGLGLLGGGAFALWQGESWFTSPGTGRVVGIVMLVVGALMFLCLACVPFAYIMYFTVAF